MKRILALAFLCLFAWASVEAVVVTYSGTSKVNLTTDSSGHPCRPVLAIFDNSDLDTARMASRDSVELEWPYFYEDTLGVTQRDSCACLVKLRANSYDLTYNPSGDVHWFLANGFRLVAPIAWGPPEIVRRVDSIFAGGGGGGGGSCDSIGPYADSILVLRCSDSTALSNVAVRLIPNGGGDALDKNTDANGWAKFSVLADTYLVLSWTVGYNQAVVPDTNRVPATNTKDTIFMCAASAPTSPAPSVTGVTFRLFAASNNVPPTATSGDSLKSATLYWKLDAGSSIAAWSFDSTKVFDPSHVFDGQTAASGTITVYVVPNDSIYTDGYETGKTRWIFWARSPLNGDNLLGKDGVKLFVPASQTALVWPKDF